jgi:hypothetical protein
MNTNTLQNHGLESMKDQHLVLKDFVLVNKKTLSLINQTLQLLVRGEGAGKQLPASQIWFQLLSQEKELIAYTSLLIDFLLKESSGQT